MDSPVKSLLVVRVDTMNLFWTLFLCALGFQSTVQLLPKTVIPLNYKLDLFTNFGDRGNEFEFSGHVTITIKCLTKTKTITLHSKNLRLGHVDVTHDVKRIKGPIQFDQKEDLLTVRLPDDLEKNNVYRVVIGFSAKFETVLKGFTLSRAKNPKTKKTVYSANTYLQNGNARKVFPCFDEPEFKTPFEINIGHTKKYKVISNMPEDHTGPIQYMSDDWIWTYFKKTAPLSTDQVTFTVFDAEEKWSKNYLRLQRR